MSLHSRDSIEAQVNQLIRRYKVERAPVDVEAIARELDVTIHYERLEDEVSGMLAVKSGEKHIVVNKDHHPNRQRFTIAHEIGHLVLHYQKGADEVYLDTKLMVFHRSDRASDYNLQHGSTTSQQEREANIFASCLLMPRKPVEDYVNRQGGDVLDEFDVSQLASSFEVSEQAMYIRLSNLKLVESTY